MTLKPGGECKLMMYANNSWKKTWKKTFVDSGLDQFEPQSGVPITHTYKTSVVQSSSSFVKSNSSDRRRPSALAEGCGRNAGENSPQ